MITAVGTLRKNLSEPVASAWNEHVTKSAATIEQARSFELELPETSVIRKTFKRLQSPTLNAWVGLAIAAATLLPVTALLWKPVFGVYAVALAFALLLALALKVSKARKLAIAASVLPLADMVSLSLPATKSTLVRVSVQYATLLVLGLVYGRMFKQDKPISKSRIGLKRYPQLVPIMIIIGELLGAASFLLLKHQYPYREVMVPVIGVAVIAFAVAKEVYFRGLLQRQAAKSMSPLNAAVIAVIAYTAASISTGSEIPTLFALLSGIVLSTIYYYKPNLILTTVANASMKLTYLSLVAMFVFK